MKSFVRAYLDDYQKITVVINRTFCGGRSDVFYLVKGDEYHPLTVRTSEEKPDKIIYHVTTDQDIVIGDEYEVMIVNACKIHLEYRFIVKTARFNDEFYYGGDDLGCRLGDQSTSFALWAPTASQVKIELEHDGTTRILSMTRGDRGVWRIRITPEIPQSVYRYLVRINGDWTYVTDPYARASIPNSEKSVVVEENCPKHKNYPLEKLERYSEAVIYEACIRDMSEKGTFLAAIDQLDYLQQLGITHLQLMPVNDFGSVDELHPQLFYNWGYDPVQFQVLEGSYSSNVHDSQQVRKDFTRLVQEAHERGIKVNLDVVFNHVHVFENSSFQLSVPYYYFRYYPDGRLSDGSGCGNDFDSQMLMGRKYILDTLKYYVKCYDVDGFRFDLMGLLDIETINEAVKQLKSIKPDIMIYGEGWNMNCPMRFEDRACKENHDKLPSVAFFNDFFRDSLKGNTFDAADKGYGSGDILNIDEAIAALKGLTYGDPDQSVNYVECHDDMTCYDKLLVCCRSESPETVIKRQKLLLGCVLLAQGIPFIHAGQEYCRSKNGFSNTYNKPDSINKLNPADRERYHDIIDYVRRLIQLRKQLHIASDRDEITHHISFKKKSGCVIYELDNREGRRITIIINPAAEKVEYKLNGSARELFEHEGTIHDGHMTIEPVSITILEDVSDDQS